MKVPDELFYTKTHEWAGIEGKLCRVGITDHAQQHMTDIVYVELPEKGKKVSKGEEIAVIESVKAAADVYAPVSGVIVDV
ncbi:MAG: glycine cleavage system protein H, partial [Thermoplasmata archaeon]